MTRTTRPMLALLLLAGSGACGGEDGRSEERGAWTKRDEPTPVTVVEIAPVRTGSVADVIATSAVVESRAAADIIPMSTGIVVSLHKDEGDPVRKGELLAVLDNVSVEASAERAASDLRRLQEQYAEMERLAAQGAVSDRELSDLRYQLESARTSMREAARTQGQTRLTAPFDGVVARRDVRVGELAGSSAAAFQVVDLDQLRVVASLPERDLPRIAVGQRAVLTSAYDPDRRATGVVERIAPVVDAGSGTFRVTVAVDPDQEALRPGQFVTVDLEVDRREGVVVIPRSAIVYEDGAPVAYVYDDPPAEEPPEEEEEAAPAASWLPSWLAFGAEEEAPADEEEAPEAPAHRARRVPLSLGLVDAEVAEVVEGLEVGEQVIVIGQSHLRDGARVRDVAEADEATREAAAGTESDQGETG